MPHATSGHRPALAETWQQRLAQHPTEPLKPPIWAMGGHAQTLLGHLLPSKKPNLEGEVIEVELDDGDRLRGFYYSGEKPVLVYIFHGLGGSSEADYMKRTLGVCRHLGFAAICMNHRGCGIGRGLARHPYHSGRGEDLSKVFEYGRGRFPHHAHLAVGFSLSGNALLLLLSGKRGSVFPDGAIAVNGPIDLARASKLMQRGMNRIYETRFVIKCRNAVREKLERGLIDTPYRIPLWIHLEEFDRIYTAPEGGFEDPPDYYRRCSTYQLLDRIKTPTVLLTAQDDPFVAAQDYRSAELSPWVYRHIEASGGHMGYLTAKKHPVFGHRWMDYALGHYLETLREFLRDHCQDLKPA